MKKSLASVIFVCVFLSFSINAQTVKNSTLPTDLLDLPAPPSVIPAKKKVAEKLRPEDFYDEKNIPPDDAPIEDLLDYWKQKSEQFDEFRYNLQPSKKSLERILGELREKPELVADYVKILPPEPEVIDVVKKAYEKKSEDEERIYYRNNLRIWLRNNSDTFIDELLQSVQTIKMGDRTLNNQEDLEALARVDWDRAKPFIDKFEADRASVETYTLAKFVLYHHALKEKNDSDAESHRGELKKLVEDKSLSHKARDLAMDALVLGGDFEGRTEWYISLLNDETLLELQDNGFTGLTTLPRHMPANREEWLASMARLVESGTPAERSAAIRNLLLIRGKNDKEVLKILLPWLTDKNWARESDDDEREQYVAALGTGEIPEAVPGLISIITNEEGSLRLAAAISVASYDAPQAIPALRNALMREDISEYREPFIDALIKLKGFSIEEQIAGLEAFAARLAKLKTSGAESLEDELTNETIIGRTLSFNPEPDDMLVMRCLERLKVLRKTNSPIAAQFSDIIQKWKNRLVDVEMLDLAKSGKADVAVIVKLLARREDLRKRVPAELSAMKMIDGLPRGLSAAIMEDQNEIFHILKRGDSETQISALAAARLIRMKIPVGDVAPFLSNPNKSLALAAERYLETEDSPEARNLILAKYADETRILGARKMFIPVENKDFGSLTEPMSSLFRSVGGNSFTLSDESKLDELEKNLRDEVKQNPDLKAVFALLKDEREQRAVVRLFKDKIVFTQYEDQTRYYDRELSAKEYEAFYRFLIDSKIDTYQYTNETCFNCANSGEFLMFGRGGGRRVFAQQGYVQHSPAMDKLFVFFQSFAEGDLKLHYKLAEKINGLEVLLANDKFTARALWKNGADFRVLVEDKDKEKVVETELKNLEKAESADASIDENEKYSRRARRRQESAYKHFSWRKIEDNKLSDAETEQPETVKFLGNKASGDDAYSYLSTEPDNFRQRADGSEFRAGTGYGGDLVKVTASGAQTVVKQGNYRNPVVSPDGKWLIAEKTVEEGESKKLMRINLQNGSETLITGVPQADVIQPVAFVNSRYKFLVARARFPYSKDKNNPSPKTPEYYLLDPNTGAAQLAKGEFTPIFQQTYRGLQPTTNPSEFWAAIYNEEKKYTEIGRYNEKTAIFKSVLQLPDISLDSMKVWIDETASKVYFIYNGHLLAVPLTK